MIVENGLIEAPGLRHDPSVGLLDNRCPSFASSGRIHAFLAFARYTFVGKGPMQSTKSQTPTTVPDPLTISAIVSRMFVREPRISQIFFSVKDFAYPQLLN